MKIAVALVHIFFATIWLGSAFFYSLLLLPRLRILAGAGQRQALTRSLRAIMTPLLAASALLTIISGLVMMVQLHSLHPGSFSHTRWGLFLIIGALASVAALAIALLVESLLRREDSRRGSAAQAQGLARRERALRLIGLALLLLALATMAVARYS